MKYFLVSTLTDEEVTAYCYNHFRSLHAKFTAEMSTFTKLRLLQGALDEVGETRAGVPMPHWIQEVAQ